MDELKDAYLDAGWTLDSSPGSYVVLSYTGLPADTQTAVFNGTTYTAKNSPTLPTHFQIEATAKDTYDSLAAAIESQDAALDAVNTGTGATGSVTVTWAAGGTGLFTASETLNNATLDATTSRYGGYKLLSGMTPQGLRMKLWIWRLSTDTYTAVRVRGMSVDESAQGVFTYGEVGLNVYAGRLLEIVANPYQFFVWLKGSTTTLGCVMYGGVPYIRPAHIPKQIVDVVDNGGEFEIECAVPHGLVTTQHAFLDNCQGVTGLNGAWQITVVDQYKYVLDDSSYSAGYVENSGFAAGPNEISRAIFLVGQSYANNGNATNTCWRTMPYSRGSYHSAFLCFNQYAYSADATDDRWSPNLQFPIIYDDANYKIQVDNFGPYADIIEARVCWRLASKSATHFTVGELWDAFVLTDTVNADVEKINFDSYNWINFMDNSTYMSLWLATGVVI
ncbi:MAG TPA: hypothetical protein VFI02_09800 [Armatimonadota bacterium]|nr:hypothetical protein [Armatimonadota bacterium]